MAKWIIVVDDDTANLKMAEMDGFEVGVSDFIRKPFNPDVLLRRLDNILSSTQQIISLTSEATIDKLTGFLNKKK